MAQFTAISLTTTTDHIARIHRTGCEGIAKDLRTTGGTAEIINAENGSAAAESYISGELDEMGYSVADVRILACAKRSAVSAAKAATAVANFSAPAPDPMAAAVKVCTSCSVSKLVTEFTIRASEKDGRRTYCRTCAAAKRAAGKARKADRAAVAAEYGPVVPVAEAVKIVRNHRTKAERRAKADETIARNRAAEAVVETPVVETAPDGYVTCPLDGRTYKATKYHAARHDATGKHTAALAAAPVAEPVAAGTTQARVAKHPEDYVARMNRTYAGEFTFSVASIDGETPSGLKRYTLRIEQGGKA